VLLCVQVVQTNNNEFNWKEEKKQPSHVDKQKIYKLAKKAENFNQKNLIDKIHKLIVKELKLNVNCHVKTR
jgi:hypothetical protein